MGMLPAQWGWSPVETSYSLPLLAAVMHVSASLLLHLEKMTIDQKSDGRIGCSTTKFVSLTKISAKRAFSSCELKIKVESNRQ